MSTKNPKIKSLDDKVVSLELRKRSTDALGVGDLFTHTESPNMFLVYDKGKNLISREPYIKVNTSIYSTYYPGVFVEVKREKLYLKDLPEKVYST